MKCRDIMRVLERIAPVSWAESWDNVGLLLGREERNVSRILVTLDVTEEVVEQAVADQVDMIVSHHPLIFQGLKRVTDQDFIGNRVLKLLQGDISYYAMHTNYDAARMGELASKRLGWKRGRALEPVSEEEGGPGIGQIADLEEETTLEELGRQVKEAFGLPDVRVFGDPKMKIRRAAILPGSGKSGIGAALEQEAQVLITGDIGHHDGIDGAAQGLAVIDGGHYGIEHIFVDDMRRYVEEHFPGVQVKTEPVRHPFWTV